MNEDKKDVSWASPLHEQTELGTGQFMTSDVSFLMLLLFFLQWRTAAAGSFITRGPVSAAPFVRQAKSVKECENYSYSLMLPTGGHWWSPVCLYFTDFFLCCCLSSFLSSFHPILLYFFIYSFICSFTNVLTFLLASSLSRFSACFRACIFSCYSKVSISCS